METIEIYKKEGMGRTKKECEEKELLRTQQEIESLKQWKIKQEICAEKYC